MAFVEKKIIKTNIRSLFYFYASDPALLTEITPNLRSNFTNVTTSQNIDVSDLSTLNRKTARKKRYVN